MSDMSIWFGVNGQEGVWYIKNGPSAFSPIDLSALPGPQPSVAYNGTMVTARYIEDDFDSLLIYNKRILADTEASVTTIDAVQTWNVVKNMQVKSDSAQNLYVDGIVHVDAEIGVADTTASNLFLNGCKRANVITGLGDDVVEIRMVSDQQSVWVDDFRIATGGGKDFVRFDGLDVAAELLAGDLTYIESVNKPGLPLITAGDGRFTHVSTGANDDTIIGYTSNDHIIAGTDDGSVEAVFEKGPASGFGYAIGGKKGMFNCDHDSTLYKIDLATGCAIAIGEVSIQLGRGKHTNNLDVESLSLNHKDGFLYGFATGPNCAAGLIKVDPNTAQTTFIGGNVGKYASSLQDMAFDCNGTLWLIAEHDLVKVNTVTGRTTVVGNNTLSSKIGAMAIDAESGRMFALEQCGAKTVMHEINKANGKVIDSWTVDGLWCADIEGMSFDSDGTLWALDRVSGKIVTIDLETHDATYVSRTLGSWQQSGDGFEALAIDGCADLVLADLLAKGGDSITTGAGVDHLFYAAGDGVDVVSDFAVGTDILHISGYTAEQIRIDSFGGDTFIRFTDSSADGFVDNALIELSGVASFDASLISAVSAAEYYMV